MQALFSSIFTTTSTTITLEQVGMTFGTSLLLGIILSFVYKYRSQYSKEFVVTLALLPTLIAIIIFLVNGNLGTSVAVAGAFSLIRFRSAAGSSKELLAVFMATAIGLATGMGYLFVAIFFTLLLSLILIIFEHIGFAQVNQQSRHLLLTVDKDFNYEQLFERHFQQACKKADLVSVHYKKKKEVLVLEYHLELDKNLSDKQILDTLLETGPRDVVLHKQIPKMKRL